MILRVTVDLDRETLGKMVHRVYEEYSREAHGNEHSFVKRWEELDEWNRELDRRTGETIARNTITLIFGDMITLSPEEAQ